MLIFRVFLLAVWVVFSAVVENQPQPKSVTPGTQSSVTPSPGTANNSLLPSPWLLGTLAVVSMLVGFFTGFLISRRRNNVVAKVEWI